MAAAGVGYLVLAFPVMPKSSTREVTASAERLARGTYLAEHVAACIDCHSERDYTRFSGPIVPGTTGRGGERFGHEMGLPGEIVAPNITPYALSSWSDGELVSALTVGVTPDGRALFPLMNYPAFAKLCRDDVDALVTYLRKLEPVDHLPPATKLDFPVNLIVRTMPTETSILDACPDRKDTVAYGKYLVNAAGCVDCHTKREGPSLLMDRAFAGGFEMTLPTGKKVVTKNITPDPSGIGGWSREAFIKRFATYRDPANLPKVSKDDFNTAMPWSVFAGMTDEDLGAIYDYL
ncbi:MAG: cytochrome, partial [Myxococcaceae bacterium]|nr:cytochrome [Myxococcaceae bacterium]